MLVLVTVVGGYWFVLRGGDAGATGFLRSERNVATAGRTVLDAGTQVQRFLQLERFSNAVDAQLAIIATEQTKLDGMVGQTDGTEAAIIRRAHDAALQVGTATEAYRTALTKSDIIRAQRARADLEAAIKRLEAQARAWNRQ